MKLVMKKLQDNCPVMVTTIPKPIMKEIGVWVNECKKIKNHPLAELKAHENVGYVDTKNSITSLSDLFLASFSNQKRSFRL